VNILNRIDYVASLNEVEQTETNHTHGKPVM